MGIVSGISTAVRGTRSQKVGWVSVNLGRGSGSWDRPTPIWDGIVPIRDRAKQTGIGSTVRWDDQKCARTSPRQPDTCSDKKHQSIDLTNHRLTAAVKKSLRRGGRKSDLLASRACFKLLRDYPPRRNFCCSKSQFCSAQHRPEHRIGGFLFGRTWQLRASSVKS